MPRVVMRWLSLGLTPGPPWTLQQSHNVRDMTDTRGRRRRGPQLADGTMTRWNEGCSCNPMSPGRERRCQGPRTTRAQKRLPAEVRQQLLDAIYSGQPFRTVLRDVGRTSNQVWGFTKTDQEWSERLEAALRQPS
jgi:hypothetical protein